MPNVKLKTVFFFESVGKAPQKRKPYRSSAFVQHFGAVLSEIRLQLERTDLSAGPARKAAEERNSEKIQKRVQRYFKKYVTAKSKRLKGLKKRELVIPTKAILTRAKGAWDYNPTGVAYKIHVQDKDGSDRKVYSEVLGGGVKLEIYVLVETPEPVVR